MILFATLMATAGTGISIIAFPWLALQRHDSAKDASIVAAAMTVPLVFSTLVAGTAVDFFGRRRVSLVSDSLSGTAVAAVPLTAIFFGRDAINLVELAVLAFLAAVGRAPQGLAGRLPPHRHLRHESEPHLWTAEEIRRLLAVIDRMREGVRAGFAPGAGLP